MERGFWDRYRVDFGASAFNVCYVARIQSKTDILKLENAFNTVLARHCILSCNYTVKQDGDVERIISGRNPRVSSLAAFDIRQEVNRASELENDLPISVTMSLNHLVVTFNHIIRDLTTVKNILGQVASEYEGSSLPSDASIHAKRSYTPHESLAQRLDFWVAYLPDAPKPSSPDRGTYSGSSIVYSLPKSIFKGIIDLSSQKKFTLHQLALAGVALAMVPDKSNLDIVLGAPFINRGSTD